MALSDCVATSYGLGPEGNNALESGGKYGLEPVSRDALKRDSKDALESVPRDALKSISGDTLASIPKDSFDKDTWRRSHKHSDQTQLECECTPSVLH